MNYKHYAAAVLGLGAAALVAGHVLAGEQWSGQALTAMAVTAALVSLSRRLPFKVSPQASASLSAAPLFMGAVLLAPVQAALAGMAGSAIADRWLGRRPLVGAFNAAVAASAATASSLLFHGLQNRQAAQLMAPSAVGSAVLAGLLLLAITFGLVAGMVSVKKGTSFWTLWHKTWAMDGCLEGGAVLLGYLGAVVTENTWWGILMLATPVGLAQWAMGRGMAAAKKNVGLAEELRDRSLKEKQIATQLAERLSSQNTVIVNSVGDGILGLDPAGRVAFVNPAALTLLGKQAGDLVGRQAEEILHLPAEAANGNGPFPFSIPPGTARLLGEATLTRQNSHTFAVEYTVTPIDRPDHQLSAVVTFRDTTERAQLQQLQKMETVGRLAGGVAHDFNNLLTPILGFAELGLKETAGQRTYSYFDEIAMAGRRAQDLVQQLLNFSRRKDAQPEVLDIHNSVADIEGMLQRMLPENISLSATTAENLSVKIDRSQLQQVIVNLVVNARDAMPEGGKLLIRASSAVFDGQGSLPAPGLKPGRYVVLAVTDTGIGMSPEVQARLFEPFFTTKAPGKGTGLGLSTCYGIVKQYGGAIAVESAPGQGSTFRVYLPEAQ